MTLLEFFFDPLYRAPFIGSMLMCLSASLVGALMFVKRRTLYGETLSHATYPGVVMGALVGALILEPTSFFSVFIVLGGAFIFAYFGLEVIEGLTKRFSVHLDAALCFVLSISLGLGVLVASRIQFSSPLWYQQSQVFIYGQAATMTDVHILVYGIFSLVVTAFVLYRFKIGRAHV